MPAPRPRAEASLSPSALHLAPLLPGAEKGELGRSSPLRIVAPQPPEGPAPGGWGLGALPAVSLLGVIV